ncbi:MAG TPA: S8 family peptidase, partial [Terriglobia bacterium]|nr:S8 family peptidase [Terriglobia bacterium]
MKRITLVISFLALLMGSAFGQGKSGSTPSTPTPSGQNQKLDKKLNDKAKNQPNEKVRVIIQRTGPVTTADNDDVKKQGGKIIRNFHLINAHVVEVPAKVADMLTSRPNVKNISIDEPAKATVATTEPSIVTGADIATQTYGVTGNGIGVAIIDSGIATHPDLPNVVNAVDFVDSTRTGGYDPFGHGTHVAGTLAGNGAASGGMHMGSAPGVGLIDLRVLDGSGSGYTSDVIAAIEWAVTNQNAAGKNGRSMNIRVINLSLGHEPFESATTDPLTLACRTAVQNGIVVVAAAGNLGKDATGKTVYGGITSPGNEPTVITVGAVTTWGTYTRQDDAIATYSSRGPTYIDHYVKPDVVAPGGSIVAAMSPGSYLAVTYPTLQQDGSYLRLSGTSMATPTVSGAVALMLQANPSLRPNAVKAALMFTSEKMNASPLAQGAGYINTAGAVNLVENIDTTVASGQYWIRNNGLGLNYNNTIANGWSAAWGQTIVWGDSLLGGNTIFNNTIVWGDTI